MAQILDLSDRFKLRFSGPQALWFLDQLVTNQVVELKTGSGRPALLLTPKGRITAVLRVLATEDGALVDVEAEDPPAVLDFLSMRIFTTKVAIDDVTGDFAILRVIGGDAAQLVERFAHPSPEANGVVAFGDGYVVTLDDPLVGVDLWMRSVAKNSVRNALVEAGTAAVSSEEYEAYRVARGLPVFGVDFDSTYLPQEAALERAVHFKKGCYLGQEAVAMTQRGKVKRRVRHLRYSGAPALGQLWQGDTPVGTVTSAAARDGESFGLATVKTTVEPGAEVEIGSAEERVGRAEVRVLPATVEGPSVPSARELRERLRRG